MNRKSFGRPCVAVSAAVLALFLAACAERIPGDPGKTMAEYVGAVQKGDFAAMYKLNRVTARQKKYILKSNTGDINKLLSENYEANLAKYKSAEPTFYGGVQWQEKYFFPPSAAVRIGKPQNLPSGEGDERKENWEKGLKVLVEVSVDYPKKDEAPEYGGQKLKSINYACTLSKIRMEGALMVYSQDPDWFVDGCMANSASALFAE
ncbi:MAG: hypothetical protein HY098_08945 [Nitrospinae bacterium]|nr:hypothetical protein [Nitrospinota bacterium]